MKYLIAVILFLSIIALPIHAQIVVTGGGVIAQSSTSSGGSGGSATNAVSTVRTNGVTVATGATSLDLLTGTNMLFLATNTGGAVTVQIHSTGMTQINSGANLSNAFYDLPSNASMRIGPGTWDIPAIIVGVTSSWSHLQLINKQNVHIISDGGTVLRESGKGRMLTIDRCTNVVFEGFTFQGFSSNRVGVPEELEAALGLAGTNYNITIRNCNFYNFYAFGIGIPAQGTINIRSRLVNIENCYFRTNGTPATTNEVVSVPRGAGIGGAGDDWTVQGCTFEWCARDYEIVHGSLAETYSGVRYINNRSISCITIGLDWLTSTNCTDILIQGNSWTNMMGGTSTQWTNYWPATNSFISAILINGGKNVRIIGNSFSGSGYVPGNYTIDIYLLGIADSASVVIEGNTSKDQLFSNFINISGGYNRSGNAYSVANNVAFDAAGGIDLWANNAIVANNMFYGDTPNGAIKVRGSTNVIVVGNMVKGSSTTPLTIDAACRNVVYGMNDFSGNTGEISDLSPRGLVTKTGQLQINDALILSNLTASSVLGLNASKDVTNLTLSSELSLSGTTLSIVTNLISAKTEDTSPASGDFLLTLDVSTAAFKKVQIANLPGGGGGPSSSNNIPFTAYTVDTGSPKTNILIDASLGTVFRVLLTNNMGLVITNGSDGQDLSIELYQDGTGNRTVMHVPNTGGTFTNNWQFGEDITSPITLTTNQFKKDLLKLRYEVTSLATNTSRSNWCVIGMLRKYPN